MVTAVITDHIHLNAAPVMLTVRSSLLTSSCCCGSTRLVHLPHQGAVGTTAARRLGAGRVPCLALLLLLLVRECLLLRDIFVIRACVGLCG
jgi:hypothetical protein